MGFDNAKGERLTKDIYEALRAGPKWNRTLLLVIYDDAGGYYDHIVPPFEGVAADEAPCKCLNPSPGETFDFKRLGLRSAAMLISPWVKAGTVFQEPKGPTNTSQFDLTSIPATLKNLFNLNDFLTKRDAWAGSFHELLTLDTPRTDAPMHLPEAPPPAKPWDPAHTGGWPPTSGTEGWTEGDDDLEQRRVYEPPPPRWDGTRADDEVRHAGRRLQTQEPVPQHCSLEAQVCLTPEHLTQKQRKRIRWLSALTKTPEPDMDSMTSTEAERLLAHRWDAWMESTATRAQESGHGQGASELRVFT